MLTIFVAIALTDTYLTGNIIERIGSVQEQENYKQLEILRDEFLYTETNLMDLQKLIASIQDLFKTK